MKKYISAIAILLSVLILFSSMSLGTISAATELGDADKNGSINLQDALWIRKYLVKESTPRNIRSGDPADVNVNVVLDTDDLRQLRRFVAGLQKIFYPSDYVPTTASKTTATAKPTTTHNNTANPYYVGGVPRYYYDQLAANVAIDNCPYYSVLINQAGYSTNAEKIVKLTEGVENQPVNSLIANATVYLVEENTKEVVATFTSGRKNQFMPGKIFGSDDVWYSEVDISSYKTPGTYRIYAPSGYSYAFTISDNPYNKAIDEMLMALYYQRCGGELSDEVLLAYDKHLADRYGEEEGAYYAKYSAYEREACHLESTGDNKGKEVVIVDTFDPDATTTDGKAKGTFVANTDEKGNVITLPATDFAYGLHDAGDYGRYVQPGLQVIADLCYAYEMYPEVYENLNVIQDTNSKGEKDDIPDILDQIRWEAKFILNMQNKNPDSSTYGGFYFKICTDQFASATYSTPNGDKGFNGTHSGSAYKGFRVMSVNFATTAGAVGALASCAYTFKDIDPDFSAECLEAAKLGYDWYVNNRTSSPRDMTVEEKTARDQAPAERDDASWQVGGGSYGGSSTEANSSQFYMYAALYRMTGDSAVHQKILATSSIPTALENQKHGGYGTLCYALTADKKEQTTDPTTVTNCKNVFATQAAKNDSSTSSASFGDLGNYGWGSNSRQANTIKHSGIADYFGFESLRNASYIDATRSVLNFTLGMNVLGYCFVVGLSEGSTKYPHHYPSVILNAQYKVPYVPGVLAGGYVTGEGGPFRYYDKNNDYVCNEICIYWNSSAIFAYAPVVQEDIDNAK